MPAADLAPQIPYPESHHQQEKKTGDLTPTGISPVHSDKHTVDGIEMVQQVVWQGWDPGSEYTKNIILKNVTIKVQKLQFSSPETRFFSTLYPKAVMLSPGTSFCLPVTFRPLEKIKYEDRIHFKTKEGKFEVPLFAVLPVASVSVPDMLDFHMCAAFDASSLTFKVINTGDMDTTVQWVTSGPFSIEPIEAFIKYDSFCQFTTTFRPGAAAVYELEAVCHFGPENAHIVTTTLKGIGKFPHLLVSSVGRPASTLSRHNLEAVVYFGVMPVGSTTTRWLELHNLSPVNAPFQVEHTSGLNLTDRVFHTPQSHGVVPANSVIRIPVTFSPNTINTTTTDYFSVTAVGNVSKSLIKCIGSSKGPTVQLGTTSINFNQIDVGETATRTIDVINTSDVDAVYQFLLDGNESVFHMQQSSGEVKANSHVKLSLTFNPVYAINYFRRITCLIHNQGPLYLDLLGTCHSELVKPAMLLSSHVQRYYTHAFRGLSLFPPEQLNQLLQEKKLKIDQDGCLLALQAENQPSAASLLPFEEYFNDGVHSDVISNVPHVSADISYVDFGNCQNMRTIEEKTINITNHTRGKILVQWNTRHDHVFTVVQTAMEIPPLKACSFRIKFQPTAPNQMYGAELECYAYYKSTRDYRLVQDATQCPPWCLTFTCTGHTFQLNNETFLPWYQMDSSSVVFPAVSAKESSYCTLLLTNCAKTPIMYNIEKDPNNVFAVKPFRGLLQDKHQIFVVRATPEKVQTYNHNMVIRLNDNEKYDQAVQLWASAECPEMLLESEGSLFFKPTCIGTSSQRTYTIKNTSRIPLRFEWHMKPLDARQLKVHPDAGIISPNETQSQLWTFTPRDVGKQVLKPSLVIWGQGISSNASGGKKREFPVRVIAEGALGSLQVEQSYLDFGDIIVGSSASKRITLVNNSSCSLIYRLNFELCTEGCDDECFLRGDRPGLELAPVQGTIAARSKQVITATVRPVCRTAYQYAVSYQLFTPEGHMSTLAANEQQHLLHILTTGVYPTMAVTDARCSGCLVGVNKRHLWNLFSLDSLNESLDANPSAEEVMYSTATRHSYRRRPPVYTRSILDFNFSAAPLGSDPAVVTLLFENPGTVDTDWAFLLPSDLQLELEYWAETGDFDEDELHEMRVMHNKLFEIAPQKGRLLPGATQVVTLTYSHTMAGTDRLPVLLKLSCGREILLNFIGMTVEPERRYIHFPSNKHMFTPVPIGEKISPKQVYELYNGGGVPVRYEFDLTPLDIIKMENYDQVIFECLNPIGEIPAGRSLSVMWRFSPLEAKTYMVDVPIHIQSGDTAIVTFTGIGYDKRIMGVTMPLNAQQELSGMPSVQSTPLPGQLAQLSIEQLSFGNFPLFSHAQRLVFVSNKSKTRAISFEWHVTDQADSQILAISPVRGCVAPAGECLCRITLQAAVPPSFYHIGLVCEGKVVNPVSNAQPGGPGTTLRLASILRPVWHERPYQEHEAPASMALQVVEACKPPNHIKIQDEHEMTLYHKKLQVWMAEQERQKHEFTITEFDLDADNRLPASAELVERPPSGRLAILEGARKLQPEGELTRYKTLPPIHQPSVDEEREARKALESVNKGLWEKPLPPRPFILHLGLTARTHDISKFQEDFPLDCRNFFINRAQKDSGRMCDEDSTRAQRVVPASIPCRLSETAVIMSTLNNILRSLLDDPFFTEYVNKVMKEPVPYFVQHATPHVRLPFSAHSLGQSTDTGAVQEGLAVSSEYEEKSVQETTTVTSSSLTCVQTDSSDELQQLAEVVRKQQEAQALKKLPEFDGTIEKILENTILNILTEAVAGEYNITARRRFVAIPSHRAPDTMSPSSK